MFTFTSLEIKAGIAVLVAGALAFGGYQVRTWQDQGAALKADNKVIVAQGKTASVEHKQAAVTQQIGQQTAAKTQQVRVVTQKVIEYVPQLITPATDHSFPLSDHFVRTLDAAITGDVSGLPVAAAGVDDTASAVAPSAAAPILVDDLGECNEAIDRANAWIEWAQAIKKTTAGAK